MSPENLGSPESGKAEAEQHERELNADHAEVRRLAKNFREALQRTSPDLANRERVIQLVEDILMLVPVRNQEFEDNDEFSRAMDRGEIEPFADLEAEEAGEAKWEEWKAKWKNE